MAKSKEHFKCQPFNTPSAVYSNQTTNKLCLPYCTASDNMPALKKIVQKVAFPQEKWNKSFVSICDILYISLTRGVDIINLKQRVAFIQK